MLSLNVLRGIIFRKKRRRIHLLHDIVDRLIDNPLKRRIKKAWKIISICAYRLKYRYHCKRTDIAYLSNAFIYVLFCVQEKILYNNYDRLNSIETIQISYIRWLDLYIYIRIYIYIIYTYLILSIEYKQMIIIGL